MVSNSGSYDKRNRIYVFLISLMLAGCAAAPKGPYFSQMPIAHESKARVYFYRTASSNGGAHRFDFWVDGVNVAKLSVHGYTYILVEPGIHRFHQGTAEQDETLISWKLEAGKEYYFRTHRGYLKNPNDGVITSKKHEQANPFAGPVISSYFNLNTLFTLMDNDFAKRELADGYRHQEPLIKIFPCLAKCKGT